MATENKNYGGVAIGQVQAIPLELVNATYNRRTVFPVLKEMGHSYINLIRLAISNDPAERKKFVDLVDEHESTPRKEGEMTVQSLAESIRANGQLQVVNVQQLGTSQHKDSDGQVLGMKYGYAIMAGNHRTAALAYLFAKYGFVLGSNPKQSKPFVRAVLIRADKEKAGEISMEENFQRKPLDDAEVGQHVAEFLENGWTYERIVERYGRSVSYYKNCLALYKPIDGVDGGALMDKLRRKEITKAEAVATASGKAPAPSRTPKAMRASVSGDAATNSRTGPVRKALAVSAIEKLIDETPHDGALKNVWFIKGLAAALGTDYDAEIQASDARIKKTKGKTA